MTEVIFIKPSRPRSEYSLTALKPAYSNQSDTITSMQNHLAENKEEFRYAAHPARCQAINRVKQLGWILSTDIEVRGDQPCANEIFMERYDMPEGWNVVKYDSYWGVYIPPGYNFMQIPTLYHTGRWYTLPGIMNGDEGHQYMNTFIIMRKDAVIPANTPLYQYFLQKKEPSPNVTVREETPEDVAGIRFKCQVVFDDTGNSYQLAKSQQLLYNPLYED